MTGYRFGAKLTRVPRRQLTFIFWVLAWVLLPTTSAISATYYIQPATGVDDAACGTAIGDACLTWGQLHTEQSPAAGDTVCLLNSGTDELNEHIFTGAGNTGTAGNPLIFDGQCGGQPNKGIIDGTGVTIPDFAGLIWIDDPSDYVHLRNLEIRDSNDENAVYVEGIGVEIDNLTVHDCGGPTDGSCIFFANATVPANSIVRNSEIYDAYRGGIVSWQNTGGYFLFENNTVYNIGGNSNFDGIEWIDTPYVIVQDNIVHSVGPNGDLIDGGGNLAAPAHHAVIQRNKLSRGPTVTNSHDMKANNEPYEFIIRHNELDYIRAQFYEPDAGTNPNRFKFYNNTMVRVGLDDPGNGGNALRWWSGDGPYAGVEAKNNAFLLSDSYLVEFQPDNEDGTFSIIKMDGNAYKFSTLGILWHDTGGSNEYNGDAAGYALWRTEQGQEPNGGLLTTQTLEQLFVNPASSDFTPKAGSDLIDAGTTLTTTTSTNTGTDVPVVDSSYFTDGYGMIQGDLVQIGSNPPVEITSINEATNTLTLASSVSWTTGDAVNLPFSGTAPDIGAIEFESAPVSTPPAVGPVVTYKQDTAQTAHTTPTILPAGNDRALVVCVTAELSGGVDLTVTDMIFNSVVEEEEPTTCSHLQTSRTQPNHAYYASQWYCPGVFAVTASVVYTHAEATPSTATVIALSNASQTLPLIGDDADCTDCVNDQVAITLTTTLDDTLLLTCAHSDNDNHTHTQGAGQTEQSDIVGGGDGHRHSTSTELKAEAGAETLITTVASGSLPARMSYTAIGVAGAASIPAPQKVRMLWLWY